MSYIFRILGKVLKLVIETIKLVITALDEVIKFIKGIAEFFRKMGKKISKFFDKLEEFFQKFKEYLKRKEKSPDADDNLDDILTKDTQKERTYLHGQGEGGPGTWENRTTPEKGADYQAKVTNAPKHTEYVVKTDKMKSGEKKFDGYDPESNTLIDAKDWIDWPPKGQKWAEDKVLKEARNDLDIAKEAGSKLEYHVPTLEKQEQLRKLFNKNGLEELIIVVTPK